MKRLGARWYLFGAQAVALHGVPRTTKDVDVTVLVDRRPAEIIRALQLEGITARFDDDDFLRQTRVIPAVHRASGWSIDVVLGGSGLEERIADEAVPRRVGAATVPLIRLEHLVVLKVLAHRPQDTADVARLLEVHHGAVSGDEVRGLLSELEQALDEGGLVRRFEELRAVAASSTPARPAAPASGRRLRRR